MKKYSWREFPPKLPAQVVGEHLETLREDNAGQLVAETVLNDARNEDSITHELFEWDDDVAAEAHRLTQAGSLLRKIMVKMEEAPEIPPVRAFVSIRKDKEKYYTSIDRALNTADLRAHLLQSAIRELQSFRKKYNDLSELTHIFEAMDRSEVA